MNKLCDTPLRRRLNAYGRMIAQLVRSGASVKTIKARSKAFKWESEVIDDAV